MKLFMWCFCSIILLLSLISCSPKEAKNQKNTTNFVLGFSQLGSESGWRIGNTESIISSAEEYGVDLLYLNAEQKYENQIKHIRRFIANQVDIIAFSPIVSTGWDNVLSEAKEAGIPVIITDRGINVEDSSAYVTFIGSDFIEEGKAAGRFLAKYFVDEDQPVRIIELRGTENSSPALGRSDGFLTVINDHSNMSIIYSVDGDFMSSRGEEIMKDVLKLGLEFDVVYSHNDSMTYGVIKALEEAGYNPGDDIVIISVDGEQRSIDLLKEGKINCVIECTPLIGDKLMEVSKKILNNESVSKVIYSDEDVFTMWDDLTKLKQRGY